MYNTGNSNGIHVISLCDNCIYMSLYDSILMFNIISIFFFCNSNNPNADKNKNKRAKEGNKRNDR